MGVRQFLDLSTRHLPDRFATQVNLTECDGLVVYEMRYGWLLWVPEDPDAREDFGPDVPHEVLVVQRYARSLGCDYVMFDRDGPVDPQLPSWDW
jgi:hypothetical protein